MMNPIPSILISSALLNCICYSNGAANNLPAAYGILKNKIIRKSEGSPDTNVHSQLVNPHSWDPKYCPKVTTLFNTKDRVIKRIKKLMNQIQEDRNMTDTEKKFQVISFEIFTKEIVETEDLILESINWLNQVLKGNFRDLLKMREGSKARLEALRDATLREEQEYKDMLIAWEHLKQYNNTQVEGLIDEILKDVAESADQLQDQLDEHLFDKALHQADMANGANIEAVIRVEGRKEGDELHTNSSDTGHPDNSVIKLIDAQDNQFVLAKGKDSTIPHEDHHLIEDMIYMLLAAFVLGWISSMFGLPTMFGYIISGVLLGPSGVNVLKSVVQLETVGQFGVFFILFSVGLEFSPSQLKQVLKVACIGTSLMMGMMVLGGVALGYVWHASVNESVFVAACLSLSSTPLVVRFLNPGGDQGPSSTDYGNILLGILIMQDVLLGLLMALLPNMATNNVQQVEEAISPYITTAVNLIGALLFVITVCYGMSRWLVGSVYKYLLKTNNKELIVLATLGLAFVMLSLTNSLKISMELGCFLAGVVVSAQGVSLVKRIEPLIAPVKDVFAAIFFGSIGLHVFPQFMAYQMTVLTTLTMATIVAKYIISVLVLAALSPKGAWHVKWIVSAGLAQVSEFSFVLGSQARRLGLISREVYLLILGITTMSLLCAPALWQLTLWQLRIKPGFALSPVLKATGHTSPAAPTDVDNETIISLETSSLEPDITRRMRQISA